VLLVRGLAGIGGVAVAGPLVDARQRLSIALPVAVQAAVLLMLTRPPGPVAAVVLVALTGYAFAAFTTPLSTRILQTAPIRVDLAISGCSTAVNVGITLGALLGSALLDGAGVRSTALVGGLLTLAALALAPLDRSIQHGRRLRPRPEGRRGGEASGIAEGGLCRPSTVYGSAAGQPDERIQRR
jgi:DHA1 family inner membrane transport protein